MAHSFNKPLVNTSGLLEIAFDALLAAKLVGCKFPLSPGTSTDITRSDSTRQAIWNSRAKLFRAWILVPVGILVILVACFGVDTLFKHFSVSFPASVACMLLLFAGLWLCELIIGNHRTKNIVAVIDVPVSLAQFTEDKNIELTW